MGFNFPAAPIVGQIYAPGGAGIPSYKWDGEKWTTQGAPLNKTPVFTDGSTAMTAQLTLFADPVALTDAADKNYVDNADASNIAGKAVRYDTAQALTAPQQVQARQNIFAAPFDALAYNGMQINGSMEVSQELGTTGAAVGVAGNKYIVDGWRVWSSGAQNVTAIQQTTAGFVPLGFTSGLQIFPTVANAAPAGSDFCIMLQSIEGYRISRLAWGTANAQPITIGFWVYANRTGPYSLAIRNSASNRAYVTAFSVVASATFEWKTVTVPGDVAGVWLTNNGAGIVLSIGMMVGAALQTAPNAWTAGNFLGATGTVNGVAATSDVMIISGVVVLPGIEAPSAARSPLIMRPYATELFECQRYLMRYSDPGNGTQFGFAGIAFSATAGNIMGVLPRELRALPTITFNSINLTDIYATNNTLSTLTLVGSQRQSLTLGGTVAAGLVAGRFYGISTQGGAGWLQFDARL